MIFRLNEQLLFPDLRLAEPDGLLAVGGDLSPQRLMLAYRNGIFPWYSEETPILWYAPHQRFVLFPDALRISKSMKQVIRSGRFQVTIDRAFEQVITECSKTDRKDQDGTWITRDMINAYTQLYQLGFAHAVEVWQDGILVGGLYGISVGNIFCGESMFSAVSNASKIALISLCQDFNFELVDCQVYTEHLASLGASMIDQETYLSILNKPSQS